MSHIPPDVRTRVTARADNRCEYCGLAQVGQEAAFHIDHVTPRANGGSTTFENLALACVSCSLRKGARQMVPDPDSGAPVPLFNPRTQVWAEHFRWDGPRVIPLTATGRGTIATLKLNRPVILAVRQEEALRGRHPRSALERRHREGYAEKPVVPDEFD